ncbi:hypothetical protein, partial [Alloalcanivorax xenomutans]
AVTAAALIGTDHRGGNRITTLAGAIEGQGLIGKGNSDVHRTKGKLTVDSGQLTAKDEKQKPVIFSRCGSLLASEYR